MTVRKGFRLQRLGMIWPVKAAILGVLVLAGGACGRFVEGIPERLGDHATVRTSGRLLIKWHPDAVVSMQTARAWGIQAFRGAVSVEQLALVGWSQWQLVSGRSPDADFIADLKRRPGVLDVQLSHIYRSMERQNQPTPRYNDPLSASQYALQRVDSTSAHDVTHGDRAQVVAIVDTGVDYNHPDLREEADQTRRVIKGMDFVNIDEDPMDRNGHGTHCAGVAGATANNREGIVGLAPRVRLLACRVLGDNGAGSDAAVAAGIIDAANRGAGVISLSLGGPDEARVINDAVRYAQNKGALLVAAMGNEGRARKSYPAALPGVVAVGATDAQDTVCAYSNHGAWNTLVAPGDAILSTLPTQGSPKGRMYGLLSGTSMATPCVAGIAALIRSQHPDWGWQQVRDKLIGACDDLGPAGFDEYYGYGRINAARALAD